MKQQKLFMQFNNKQEWLHLLKEEYMCQYQYVRLFWDIFLALLEKNYKLCCWVLRGSVENSSWGQLLPISRAMSNYEGGATQAALLPHVTPATPSGCCGQQPNAVSCFLRLTLKWMGVTRLAFIVRVSPYWVDGIKVCRKMFEFIHW